MERMIRKLKVHRRRNGSERRFNLRSPRLMMCVCAALAQMAAGSAAADSATGVDTVLGNALNPGRLGGPFALDPLATMGRRTPSGRLYGIPYITPEPRTLGNGWEYNGWLEFGGLFGDGDENAYLFRQYKDLGNGAYGTNFGFRMDKPDTANFVEGEGGGIVRKDQFYGFQFGRYNDWRVKLFYNETPHAFTTSYRSLWDGTGSDSLTLAPTDPALVPGGGGVAAASISQNVRTALATIPDSDLSLVRKKGGIEFNATLTESWKAFASYTSEKREGARPFGGLFGAQAALAHLEIPESIDYMTHELLAGLRYNDSRQSFNAQVSASLFRNNIDTLSFQNPLTITFNGITGLSPAIMTAGRYDLVPDNDYYQARLEYARSFPEFYKSRFTAVVSTSTSRQDDQLVEPTLLPLTGGTTTATGTSLTDHWNTTNALSKKSADAKIDTTLVDLNYSARPVDTLTLTGKVRYYETHNSTSYLSCNPLTGELGRIYNDGSAALLTGPLLAGGNNPPGTAASAYNTANCNLEAVRALNLVPVAGNIPIAAIPFDYTQTNYRLTGDYRIGKASSLVGTYEREDVDRENRERDRTWEDRFKLEYANRGFENATLRAYYEYAQRRGSEYNTDPSRDYTSYSLGPLPTANGTNVGTWIRILSNLRKYDLADRDSNTVNAQFNMALLPDLDGGLTAQWKDLKYPSSEFGRMDHEQRGSISVDLNYQPSATLGIYGFYAYQTGKMKQGGIQNAACIIGQNDVTAANFLTFCGAAGGPLYPYDRAWYVDSNDYNNVAGLGFRYDFDKALFDLNYTYSESRTEIGYQYGSGLGLSPTQIALIGNGWSDLTFKQNILEASLLVPINKTFAARFYYRYEDGKTRDWHYDGVRENPVPATNAVYLDSGPLDYRANVFGIFLRMIL